MNNLSLAAEHCTGLKKSELLLKRMQEIGIEKNSGDDRQYIKAKRLVESLASSPNEFDELIHVIVDFLKI